MTDPRVVKGLEAQVSEWRTVLDAGAERVGWKIGLNIPEAQNALGIEEPVIGYLTSATVVESGGEYRASDDSSLRAEPEVALEMGRDVEPDDADADVARDDVAGVAVALVLVDVGRPPEGIQGIVATNVFHRAVVLGPSRPAFPGEGLEAVIEVDGQQRERADVPDDFSDVVLLTARLLGEVGERLERGDRIIAGSLTPQVPLGPGNRVAVDIEGLGGVEARIAA
jgi:2-keto-4-pentenoate hydratase